MRSARIVAPRSVIATVACEAPMSAATTTRAPGFSANCDGGRPPVDAASATGVTRPIRMSSSTRAAIVERARPVDFASCARVRGTPSRSSWNSSVTPDSRGSGFHTHCHDPLAQTAGSAEVRSVLHVDCPLRQLLVTLTPQRGPRDAPS